MSTQAIVQVSDLQQGYGTKTVLSHINLTLNRGQILALIGPSGAGKTTLISTIMGMIRPRAGKVTVFNQHVPNRLLLGRIGFMAQTDALYESLTGAENLTFFAKMQGVGRYLLTKQLMYAADVVDLQTALKQLVKDYSGGEKTFIIGHRFNWQTTIVDFRRADDWHRSCVTSPNLAGIASTGKTRRDNYFNHPCDGGC